MRRPIVVVGDKENVSILSQKKEEGKKKIDKEEGPAFFFE